MFAPAGLPAAEAPGPWPCTWLPSRVSELSPEMLSLGQGWQWVLCLLWAAAPSIPEPHCPSGPRPGTCAGGGSVSSPAPTQTQALCCPRACHHHRPPSFFYPSHKYLPRPSFSRAQLEHPSDTPAHMGFPVWGARHEKGRMAGLREDQVDPSWCAGLDIRRGPGRGAWGDAA